MIYTLSQNSRPAIYERVKNTPDGYVIRISEPTRTLEQNALLHAELQEIAEKVKWAGNYLDVDDWKRLLTAAWMRATDRKVLLLPAVDGHGIDALYRRTSTLSKSELSELVSYIQAWKADREEFNG